MNELQAILNAIDTCPPEVPMFLVTVVSTQGSTYRKPGARMLMMQSGQMIGAISGGCLENDLYEQTQQRMGAKSAIVVTYDTTTEEDLVWGFGIGCNGVVQVLIEQMNTPSSQQQVAFLRHCLQTKQSGIVATVFEGSDSIGSRLMLNAHGQVTTDIQDLDLISGLTKDAYIALQQRQSCIQQYPCATGAKALIEVIQPPPSLVVFGAGRDALPIVQFAKALGWNTTIVDCRASEATQERFSIADQIILARRETLADQVLIDETTIAIVMTHNYFDDVEILHLLLRSSACYIGVLGSKQRTERLLQDLYSTQQLNPQTQDRLHAPIGLDIGAETPAEIALSMLAEIQAVLHHRQGGSLKHRRGAIHDAAETTAANWADYSGSRGFNANGNPETAITPGTK
jgi:xanthine dehydrogenase accessory factor